MPNVFYMTPPLPEANGQYLEALVNRFNPGSDEDKQLIKAMLLTTLWGGTGEPSRLLADCRWTGSGKTTLAEICAELSAAASRSEPRMTPRQSGNVFFPPRADPSGFA